VVVCAGFAACVEQRAGFRVHISLDALETTKIRHLFHTIYCSKAIIHLLHLENCHAIASL